MDNDTAKSERRKSIEAHRIFTILVSTSCADFAHLESTYAFKNFFLVSVAYASMSLARAFEAVPGRLSIGVSWTVKQ